MNQPGGNGDVFADILKTVSGEITRAAGAGPPSPEAVTEVVQRAVQGTVETGGNLVMGAKAIVVGVLRGTREREDAALATLSKTARTVVRQAAALGAPPAAGLKGLVLGAIASAKDLGVDRDKAASAAARGALDGAHDAGSAAVEEVRLALREPIGGVTVGIPAPITT